MRETRGSESVINAHSRRDVLRWSGAAAIAWMSWPRRAQAAVTARTRVLSIYSVNTGERDHIEYYQNGRYQPDALRAVNRLLRDHRTDEIYPIDPALLDVLYSLRETLESNATFHVVCGYRSRTTNENRRRVSRGVAKESFHLTGQAIDLFVPGTSLGLVREAAAGLQAGGVGYYPSSNFVHVDSGPVRSWGSGWYRRGYRSARI